MLRTSVFVLTILAAGSSFAHEGSLNAEELELLRKSKVLVLIPQDKVLAAFTESHSGKDYGLVGFAIDVFENKSMLDKMNQRLLPIQQATPDLDFRRDFLAQLQGLGIFDPAHIELLEKAPESKSERLKLIAAAGDPVVLIDAQYRFSQGTYRTLAVEMAISLWTGGQKKPLHTNGTSHISVPVTLSQTWDLAPVSAPLWAEDRARRYRAAYAEGIAGSIDLFRKVLEFSPSPGSTMQERIDYCDGTMKTTKRGHVVEETSERVVLFDEMTMRSLPIVPNFAARQPEIKPVHSSAARVYFYRPGTSDTFFIEPSVYANGSKLGDLYMNSYASIDLSPGKYSFRVKYDGDAPSATVARSQLDQVLPVEIEVQPGSEYFVRYDGFKGIWTKEDVLKHIDPATAQPQLLPLLPVWWSF